MFTSATGFAQQDDLRENGPFEQRYFARERGAATKPYVPQLPALPTVPFQADKDGKSNELIVLLEYGLCCTNLIQPEIPPTPDAATPQQAPPPLWGTQVA